MNQQIRICIKYGTSKKSVLCDQIANKLYLINESLKKFEMILEDPQYYDLFWEHIYCPVDDLDKLREGEVLILLKRSPSRINSPGLYASKFNTSPPNISATKAERTIEKSFQVLIKMSPFEKPFQGVIKATGTIANSPIQEIVSNKNLEDHQNGFSEEVKTEDFKHSGEKNKRFEVSIKDLFQKDFPDRKVLKSEINTWAADLNFYLIYETRERELVNENCKVSLLVCPNKDCSFFLEFKTNGKDERYILSSYWNEHSHQLSMRHTTSHMTHEIEMQVKNLKASIEDISKLTAAINKLFKMNEFLKGCNSLYSEKDSKRRLGMPHTRCTKIC